MPKRICMIAYTHYLSDARPRRAAEALVARGDEVDFLSLGEEGSGSEEVLQGVRVVPLPVARYRGQRRARYLSSYGRFFAQGLREITRRHRHRRYDVVYAHTMPDLIVFTAAGARLRGARTVLDVHDTMPELYQSKFDLKPSHPWIRLLRAQERMSCSFADRVICVHEPHLELLVSRGVPRGKISVLMNLPDPKIFGEPGHPHPGADSARGQRIVYHGTIARRLGPDLALEAFREIAADVPEARLEIYGAGDFGGRLAERIRELNLDGRVEFHNRRFRVDEVPGLIRGATVGVVPNREDAATAYMLPVKLLEYVYLGIPVVVPRLDTIRHYFGEDSVAFYRPGDLRDLAAALRALLTDPERRRALTHAAARFYETFSWETMKNDLYAAVDAAGGE